MTYTFLDLQNRVKERVIDLPPTVQANIPLLVNEAILSAQRKYNFRSMEGSQLMVSTVGSLTPTNNVIPNFKEYFDKGPYTMRFLVKAHRYVTATGPDAALAALADINNPSEPRYLINSVDINGNYSFTLAPYPDNLSDWPDGNYRIVVPYYAFTSTLVNDSDANWFTNFMYDYIYREATGHAFGLDWDYQSMAVWLQQADVKYQEAVKADKKSRLASVDALVPMWQGANQPQVRR